MRPWTVLAPLTLAAALLLAGPVVRVAAQPAGAGNAEIAEALALAQAQARRARQRGLAFEAEMQRSAEASDRAQAEAAALAARIQQGEAAIAIAEAELVMVNRQRRLLDRQLDRRREPLAELAAAIQNLVRKPVYLTLLRPGSLRETVYLGAVLDSTLPRIEAQTADLRSAIARTARLEQAARDAIADRRTAERALATRRAQLVALSERDRLVARRAGGAANREEARALALAEEARDLDALVGDIAVAGELRARLAALQGPVMRPATIAGAARRPVPPAAATIPPPATRARAPRYRLPVDGRVITGFGELRASGGRSRGIELASRPGAQVVAPAAGRVAFAGPYRGYGRIVILEHAGGWTSLVTGLGALETRVGQPVIAGSPLGRAAAEGRIGLELRRKAERVNPLDLLASSSSNGA